MQPDPKPSRGAAPDPRTADWGRSARSSSVSSSAPRVLPLLLGAVVRSERVHAWASTETERLLQEQKIVASYDVGLTLWPAPSR